MSLKTEKEHFLRVEASATRVQTLYYRIVRDFAQHGAGINPPFKWAMNPQLEKILDDLIREFRYDLDTEMKLAIEREWFKAIEVNEKHVKRLASLTTISPEKLILYNSRNLEALSALQGRKIGEATLSKRIWNLSKDLKREFEMALNYGLADGRSADALSRDIRKFLNRPNDLYRRVRTESGRLIQSQSSIKRIKAEGISYGRGYYRSSYKNAMRVARTEINNAYRMSDYHKRQQLDFVVGIDVRRSNHKYDCDVCESLKGKYPKDFVFTSWHPHCRCFSLSVLASDAEFIAQQRELLKGNRVEIKSKNVVKDVPPNYKNWLEENKERIERSNQRGTSPHWMRDNRKYL